MSFIENVENTLNVSYTENGARGLKTTGKNLLDMNFKVTSYRNMSESEITRDFLLAYEENPVLAIKWLFYSRDVRGGLGERRLFRVITNYLATMDVVALKAILQFIPEYGRWDDLLSLYNSPVKSDVVDIIKNTLMEDMVLCKQGKSGLTLLAKWLPSENASSSETRIFARNLIRDLGITPKEYRKTLSALRKHLNVLEIQMSNKQWQNIDYPSVPSKANVKYNKAFMRNDEERRTAYLNAVKDGHTTIKATNLFPYEIVAKYKSRAVDDGLEALWKALPDLVNGESSTLVVADGSASMTWNTIDKKSSATPLTVANSLAIYFAERCSGEFKNKYITFSSNPRLVNLSGKNLRRNLDIALQHSECSNTNIEAVFDLVLNTAVQYRMEQSELPGTILVMSDMEFDGATYGRPDATLFRNIQDKFEAKGYAMPKLVFWNLCGRTSTIPMSTNKLGVNLISGFSVNTLKMVMCNETDPYSALLSTINTDRYLPIEEALWKIVK